MITRRFILILVLLFIPTSVATAQHMVEPKIETHFPADRQVVEIPFRFDNNKIVVAVQVNGKGPFDFVLDTGAGTSYFLSGEKASAFDMEVVGQAMIGGAGGDSGPRTVNLLSGVTFGLGGIELSNNMMAAEPPGADSPLPGAPWDGIFGGQVFENLVVEIDFEHEKLRFYEPTQFKPPSTAKAFPLTLNHGHPFIQAAVSIDGGDAVPIDLVIDSGANHALSLAVESRKGLVRPSRLLEKAVLGRGLSGVIEGDVGRVRSLQLGEFTFADVITGFPPKNLNHVITSGSNGNLGSEVLRRFTAIFDYSKKLLYLEPNVNYTEPFKFSTSGLGIRPWLADDGAAAIDIVYAGSAAARAGVTKEDQILEVDERKVGELGVEDLRELLRQPPGTQVSLKLRRGEDIREVELQLESLL